jgi:hypothetical protein
MGMGTGGRGLVAESFFRLLGKTLHEIEDEDIEICIQMAILVNALSSRQNTLLSGFLNLFLTKMNKVTTTRNRVWGNKEIGWACVNCSCATCLERRARNKQETNMRLPTCLPPIPQTINRIRSVIMNGQYAFIDMIPRPMIRMQGNHSYVLPSECIKFFLGSRHLPLLFDTMAVPLVYTSPKDTPRGVDIAKELHRTTGHQAITHFPISFFEWKDNCEPSKSNKESKSGRLWIWTMTIITSAKTDSSEATFPIAIGYKNDDHNNLERIIAQDLKNMAKVRTLCFVGSSNGQRYKEVAFSAQMFLSLDDQPERRGGNSLMGGGSRSHRRWRFACNHESLMSITPACGDCYQVMQGYDSKTPTQITWKRECSICCNWMVRGVLDPMLKYKPMDDFPMGYALGGVANEKILPKKTTHYDYPIELTYECLKKVVRLTQQKIENGEWSVNQGSSYLKENCINVAFVEPIVEKAKNLCELRQAFENAETDPSKWEALVEDNESTPHKYSACQVPGVWDRDRYVDTPMHLLFLGVVKAVFYYVGIWSSRCGRKQGFQVIAKRRLTQLDNLKLGWLTFQVDTFDGWGGWVSEKFHSLSRVGLWIYGPLMIVNEVEPFTPPAGREPKDWRVDKFKKWLTIRSLSINGTKEELKGRVLAYLSLPLEQQPKVIPPTYGTADGVMCMLRSMVVLLTTLMQPGVEGESHQDILEFRTR